MGRGGITGKSETNTGLEWDTKPLIGEAGSLQGYTQSQPSLCPAEMFTVVSLIAETRFYHVAQADHKLLILLLQPLMLRLQRPVSFALDETTA